MPLVNTAEYIVYFDCIYYDNLSFKFSNKTFFFPREAPKGAHYLSKSLDDALALLDSPELKSKVDMVWIVGGTAVYKVHLKYFQIIKFSALRER